LWDFLVVALPSLALAALRYCSLPILVIVLAHSPGDSKEN
jgi:hypothetical protein